MKYGIGLNRGRWLAGSVLALFAAGPSLAQSAAGNQDAAVEDIVVTAQKRQQSIQDVGITMAVASGRELATKSITNIADLTTILPGTQANVLGEVVAFNIRGLGISEFATNFDSPIAVNMDEVYLSKTFMGSLLLYDIERVEELKGPQGTLFGRNATGGAVNFYTRAPTRDLQMGFTAGYDNYRTKRLEAYLSGPLTDQLAARLSGFVVHQGKGFYRNLFLGGREGAEKKGALRGQLAFEDGGTKARLIVAYGEDRSTTAPYEDVGTDTPASVAAGAPVRCPGYLAGNARPDDPNCVRAFDAINPGDASPYTSTNSLRHHLDNTSFAATLRVDHDVTAGTITSVTSYQNFRRRAQEDSYGSPSNIAYTWNNNRIEQLSQELRLGGKVDRWSYVAGLYYEHDRFSSADYFSLFGNSTGFHSPFVQKLDAYAAYFHNEVGLTDSLSLIAGLRYSREKISLDGKTNLAAGVDASGRQPATILAVLSSSAALGADRSQASNNASFKTGVEWSPRIDSDLLDSIMIYGHVSTSFRSGAYNAEYAIDQASLTKLEPEKITAYEIGFKSAALGRRLVLNGAAFRYDYENGFVNVDRPGVPTPITVNAASIRVYGVEGDLRWRVIRPLSLTLSAGYLDSQITSELTANGQALKGNRTINAPKWSAGLGGNLELPISEGLNFIADANASYRSSQFLEPSNSINSIESGYWLVGGRIGIAAADDRWQLSAWVKNLTKTKYRTYVNDQPVFGILLNVYGPPRTFGGTLSFKF